MMLDLTEAVERFKAAWAAADAEGKSGHRTEAGMAAAAPLIEAQVREAVARDLISEAADLDALSITHQIPPESVRLQIRRDATKRAVRIVRTGGLGQP